MRAAADPARGPDREEPEGLVGPNALLQTAAALDDLVGATAARDLFVRAGLAARYDRPPDAMVDQAEAARLFAALAVTLGRSQADRVLAEAGRRTGAYILDNRIPKALRTLLPGLPAALSGRILSDAIARHAWTFAGTGRTTIRCHGWAGTEVMIEIAANPLASPGCPWHLTVFDSLYGALCQGRHAIGHETCCATGADACRTRIRLAGRR